MRREPVGVRRLEPRRGERRLDAQIVLVLVHVLDDLLEHVVAGDVVGRLDDRVALLRVLVDDLLVVDDAVVLHRIRDRVGVVADLLRVGLGVVVEQTVDLAVLDRLKVLLVAGERGVPSRAEHGRGVVLGQLGQQRGVVGARRSGLHVHLHAGLVGVGVGQLLQLIDHLRLAVEHVDLALAVRGAGVVAAAAGQRTKPQRKHRSGSDDSPH